MVFACEDCGATYKLQKHLQCHIAGVHGIGFTCPVCGKRYKRRDYLSVHLRKVHPGYEDSSSPLPSTSAIPDHPISASPSVEDAAETEAQYIHFAGRFGDRVSWPADDGRELVLLGPSAVYGVLVTCGAPLPEIAEQLGLVIRSQPDYAVWEAHAVLPPWFPPAQGTDIPVVRLGCHPVATEESMEVEVAPKYSDISDVEDPIVID